MQATGFFMTLSPPNGSLRCDPTSSHTYASSVKLQVTRHCKSHVPRENARSMIRRSPCSPIRVVNPWFFALPIEANYSL